MSAARVLSAAVAVLVVSQRTLGAQQPPAQPQARNTSPVGPIVAKLVAAPEKIIMKAGETVPLKVTAYDEKGNVLPDAMVRVMGARQSFTWDNGQLHATKAGTFTAIAVAFGTKPVTLDIPLTVTWPALTGISIAPESERLYTDMTLGQTLKGYLPDSTVRTDFVATWRSSNPSVATVDRFGSVTGVKPGTVTISAEAEGNRAQTKNTVVANQLRRIDIGITGDAIRTGDVVHLVATARRADGSAVSDAPITWSYTYAPDDSLVPGGVQGGPGIIEFGRFAANYPG